MTEVHVGVELLLEQKEPLNLQDMFGDSTSADEKSDRETGMGTPCPNPS